VLSSACVWLRRPSAEHAADVATSDASPSNAPKRDVADVADIGTQENAQPVAHASVSEAPAKTGPHKQKKARLGTSGGPSSVFHKGPYQEAADEALRVLREYEKKKIVSVSSDVVKRNGNEVFRVTAEVLVQFSASLALEQLALAPAVQFGTCTLRAAFRHDDSHPSAAPQLEVGTSSRYRAEWYGKTSRVWDAAVYAAAATACTDSGRPRVDVGLCGSGDRS
jgi:hypothetical protein